MAWQMIDELMGIQRSQEALEAVFAEAGLSDALTALLRSRGLTTVAELEAWLETPWIEPKPPKKPKAVPKPRTPKPKPEMAPARFQRLTDLPGIGADKARRILKAVRGKLSRRCKHLVKELAR